MLSDKDLRFPEGTAIGKVLIASADKTFGLAELIYGSSFGAIISLCQGGFKVLSDNMQVWFIARATVFGGGLGFAPAMIGAGYIIGINVGLSLFAGVILGWVVGIPMICIIKHIPISTDATDLATHIWSDYIRYIGLGSMIVGGLWAISTLITPMAQGITASFKSLRAARLANSPTTPRTERDIPITTITWSVLLLLIPLFFVFSLFY